MTDSADIVSMKESAQHCKNGRGVIEVNDIKEKWKMSLWAKGNPKLRISNRISVLVTQSFPDPPRRFMDATQEVSK